MRRTPRDRKRDLLHGVESGDLVTIRRGSGLLDTRCTLLRVTRAKRQSIWCEDEKFRRSDGARVRPTTHVRTMASPPTVLDLSRLLAVRALLDGEG